MFAVNNLSSKESLNADIIPNSCLKTEKLWSELGEKKVSIINFSCTPVTSSLGWIIDAMTY